jgi:hypothetical protein
MNANRMLIYKLCWLMLFRETGTVYSESHTNPINTLCGQNAELLIVKAGGTYTYHRPLKS